MARPLIIDTDAGPDDLLAILYLLGDSTLKIEAITVVSGLTTNLPLAGKVLRYILEYTGNPGIPVYLKTAAAEDGGNPGPPGGHQCPAAWANKIEKLGWPDPKQPAVSSGAVDFLAQRLAEPTKRQMLALGPLTSIADALALHHKRISINPPPCAPIQLTIMGGAFGENGQPAEGNMGDAVPAAPNSEFNIYIDPVAAQRVLQQGTFEQILLVPLNACNMVPLDEGFIDEFNDISSSDPRTELAKTVLSSILANNPDMTNYFAWDPLAAMPAALVQPYASSAVVVDDLGVTASRGDSGPISVALKADRAVFKSRFFQRFGAV